jgi:hypothetical protein
MSGVRNMDGSFGNTAEGNYKFQAPPVSVCEPAQIQHRRNGDWPFMYSYEEGKCFVNTAPRKSAYAQAIETGEALL